jgi:hypothetical protein
MYSNKLKTNDKIIYASISIFLGIIIIDWLLPKTNFEKIKERMQN